MRTPRTLLVLAGAAAATLVAPVPGQAPLPVTGTNAHVRSWTEEGERRSAVSRDGGATWVRLPAPRHTINWRTRTFDPALGDPGVPPSLLSDSGNRLFFVQFATDIIPEYDRALRGVGADATRYVPHQSLIARLPRAAAAGLRKEPFVRAVADYEVGHKLDEAIQRDLLRGILRRARYNVMLFDKHADARNLEQRIEQIGGVIEVRAAGSVVLQATLSPAQLIAVGRENTVLWIDRWTEPEFDVDIARIQMGVNYVSKVAGINGEGIRGHVNEAVYNHPEFGPVPPYRTGPIMVQTGGVSTHGTSLAGVIFAQGLTPQYRGFLPVAQLLYSNTVRARYQLAQTLVDPSQPYQAMFQVAGWGGGRTRSYTSTSAEMDDITFDFNRLLVVQSHSNAGAPLGRPESWAKNVIAVSGHLHRSTPTIADDCWCQTSSTGPAQDGRVGVQFTGYYDNVNTVSGASSYTSGFGGSSGATPMIAGAGGIVIQMLTDGLFGYPATGWQNRFASRPHLTTTRVLLSVSTHQLSFVGTNKASRVQQGWGLPHLGDLYDDRDELLVLDEEDVLQTGEMRTYFVWVKPNTPQLRASMHYLEDEAVPGAIPTRINSLDLQLTAPSGAIYWGNDGNPNGILQGPYSAPGGGRNDIDIHENVFVEAPASGVWQVAVEATNVRVDNHLETEEVDADFALAIRGIGGGRDKSGMVLDLSSSPGRFDVSLTNVPAGGWSTGYTLMSLETSRHASLGNLFGLEGDALTWAILGSPAAIPGHVFHFTSSGNSAHYPNATYSFPGPVVGLLQGLQIDAVAVLIDVSGNIADVSNVDRDTFQ